MIDSIRFAGIRIAQANWGATKVTNRVAKTQAPKRSPFRKLILLGLATATCAPGCATMKPPTEWFGKKDTIAASTPGVPDSSMASSLSSAGQGISGQFKSMGTAVSSAMGKAKNAVTSTFTQDASDDATSLASLPTSLGPEVWVANGQIFEARNDYPKALDNYSKALEKAPNNESALLSIARLYARQDKSAQAVEFFQKAIAVNPAAASTHNDLALEYRKQGKAPEAQASIQQAITLDPANPRYRNNFAGMLVAAGRSDEAVSLLEEIHDSSAANYNVAFLHFSNKNLPGAQQHLEVALRANPNMKEARQLLDQLRGSPAAQSAVAAYGTAKDIYRTAEAIGQPAVAGNAVYQQPYGQGVTQNATPGMQQNIAPQVPGFPSTPAVQVSNPAFGNPPATSNAVPTAGAYLNGPGAAAPSYPAQAPAAQYNSTQMNPGQLPTGMPTMQSQPAYPSMPASTVAAPQTGGLPAFPVSYGTHPANRYQ